MGNRWQKRLGFCWIGLMVLAMLPSLGWSAQPAKPQPEKPVLSTVASFPRYPMAGVAVSKTGRMFVTFPRWKEGAGIAVAELLPDRQVRPYPDNEWNIWAPDMDPGEHFVSAQSVVVDDDDTLWILDPASPGFAGVVDGGPKLLKVNLDTNAVEQVIHFTPEQAPKQSYLNDIRVDTRNHFAYITDSGLGAIVVINLNTGSIRRVLANDASTKAEPDYTLRVNGQDLRGPDGAVPQVHADGIALDPDFKYLYYHPLTGSCLYRIDTRYLQDESLSDSEVSRHVEFLGHTGATDGMVMVNNQGLYLTSFADNAIKRFDFADRKLKTVIQDPKLIWPDTMAVSPDCKSLYVTTSQIQTLPRFNGGQDTHTVPYRVYRFSL